MMYTTHLDNSFKFFILELLLLLYFMSMCALPACMSVYLVPAEVQMRVLVPQELEPQMVVSCHVCMGILTQVVCRAMSALIRELFLQDSSPHFILFVTGEHLSLLKVFLCFFVFWTVLFEILTHVSEHMGVFLGIIRIRLCCIHQVCASPKLFPKVPVSSYTPAVPKILMIPSSLFDIIKFVKFLLFWWL